MYPPPLSSSLLFSSLYFLLFYSSSLFLLRFSFMPFFSVFTCYRSLLFLSFILLPLLRLICSYYLLAVSCFQSFFLLLLHSLIFLFSPSFLSSTSSHSTVHSLLSLLNFFSFSLISFLLLTPPRTLALYFLSLFPSSFAPLPLILFYCPPPPTSLLPHTSRQDNILTCGVTSQDFRCGALPLGLNNYAEASLRVLVLYMHIQTPTFYEGKLYLSTPDAGYLMR